MSDLASALGESSGPLVDRLGRVHTNLRISVTDRCNIRCFYCMPNENVQFRPREEILSFEEIRRFARVSAGLGINRVRLTGGEPLVRSGLPELVHQLASVDGITDLALTTNGMLLPEYAVALRQAGLRRINISLDTLREEAFRQITRRDGLDRVLAGIFAAQQAGFEKIRLNAVAMAGLSEPDIVPLGHFARQQELELRFIEFMPLDAEQNWQSDRVLSGQVIRRMLEEAFGPLIAAPRDDPSQPAVDFHFADGRGRIGFINPVSQPFCHDCNRLRLTAEGQIRNCLFSTVEWDARQQMRGGGSDAQLAELIRDCVRHKKPGHGIDTPDFLRPRRAMYQIGG
jgi:cyclic pyranopterin phosphate synthase